MARMAPETQLKLYWDLDSAALPVVVYPPYNEYRPSSAIASTLRGVDEVGVAHDNPSGTYRIPPVAIGEPILPSGVQNTADIWIHEGALPNQKAGSDADFTLPEFVPAIHIQGADVDTSYTSGTNPFWKKTTGITTNNEWEIHLNISHSKPSGSPSTSRWDCWFVPLMAVEFDSLVYDESSDSTSAPSSIISQKYVLVWRRMGSSNHLILWPSGGDHTNWFFDAGATDMNESQFSIASPTKTNIQPTSTASMVCIEDDVDETSLSPNILCEIRGDVNRFHIQARILPNQEAGNPLWRQNTASGTYTLVAESGSILYLSMNGVEGLFSPPVKTLTGLTDAKTILMPGFRCQTPFNPFESGAFFTDKLPVYVPGTLSLAYVRQVPRVADGANPPTLSCFFEPGIPQNMNDGSGVATARRAGSVLYTQSLRNGTFTYSGTSYGTFQFHRREVTDPFTGSCTYIHEQHGGATGSEVIGIIRLSVPVDTGEYLMGVGIQIPHYIVEIPSGAHNVDLSGLIASVHTESHLDLASGMTRRGATVTLVADKDTEWWSSSNILNLLSTRGLPLAKLDILNFGYDYSGYYYCFDIAAPIKPYNAITLTLYDGLEVYNRGNVHFQTLDGWCYHRAFAAMAHKAAQPLYHYNADTDTFTLMSPGDNTLGHYNKGRFAWVFPDGTDYEDYGLASWINETDGPLPVGCPHYKLPMGLGINPRWVLQPETNIQSQIARLLGVQRRLMIYKNILEFDSTHRTPVLLPRYEKWLNVLSSSSPLVGILLRGSDSDSGTFSDTDGEPYVDGSGTVWLEATSFLWQRTLRNVVSSHVAWGLNLQNIMIEADVSERMSILTDPTYPKFLGFEKPMVLNTLAFADERNLKHFMEEIVGRNYPQNDVPVTIPFTPNIEAGYRFDVRIPYSSSLYNQVAYLATDVVHDVNHETSQYDTHMQGTLLEAL